ncbi:hypothetical protein B296_00008649 [Ensete ventricosum]|uniref:Uncharacterized protein n=1 Tax=Ensete ventricosum TaxID=4639 RepID=A0A427A034_ENSVE|nr:hypothetical protein B296_00008649 [Ensete ventricosum]
MPVLISMYWSDHGLISPIGMARRSMLHATNLRKRGQDILIILLPFDEEHLAHALCRLFLLTQAAQEERDSKIGEREVGYSLRAEEAQSEVPPGKEAIRRSLQPQKLAWTFLKRI